MGKNFRETLNERLLDTEFRAEWEALEPERQIMKAIIDGREEKDLTQKQLAEATGITQADISRLENGTGNPGMSTGCCGDVLSGMIGALAAQGMDPYYAAMCGVYLHGAAGDRAAKRLSQHSMLPSDLIEELPNLFLQFEK